MKSIFAASPALLLAGAMLAAPASAQTMGQPDLNQPMAQPYPGQAAPQPYSGQTASQPYSDQAQQQTAQGTLPRGSYLNECKNVRMLQNTLTAFCPRGDGTWQTTQLQHADSCPGSVHNAGGDLVCGMPSQVGSTTPPQSYDSSSGSSYGTPAAPPTGSPPTGYGAFGTGPQPAATGVAPPAYAPVPSQSYATPSYNGYGAYTYNPYGAYPPAADQYVSPSGTRAAQPPY
jgi:hypothetical protein